MDEQIQPGPELDTLVAEYLELEPAAYSTDLAAAVKAAEALRERGWLVVMKWMPKEHSFIAGGGLVSEYDIPAPPAQKVFKGKTTVDIEYMPMHEENLFVLSHISIADTPAHAVAMAVLEAKRSIAEAERRSIYSFVTKKRDE